MGVRAVPSNLSRRTEQRGTETATEVDQLRPCGRRLCPTYKPPDGLMRGGEIPGLGLILSRFCRDPSLSRDTLLNSGSYGPLRDHTYHITKVSQETALQPLVDGPVWPASGIIPDAAQAQSFTAYRPATASPSRPSSAACPTCSASAASRLPPAASTCPASSSPSTASPTTRSSASPTTPRTRLDRGPHGGV